MREAPAQREEFSPQRAPRDSVLAGQRPAAAWWDATSGRGRAAAEPSEGLGGRWLDPELARGMALRRSPSADSGAEGSPPSSLFRKRLVYPVGINRNRLEQAIREMSLPVVISRDEREADAVLVLKSLYRTQPDRIDAAQAAGLPVYVLRSTSVERLREALADMFRGDMEGAQRSSDAEGSDGHDGE
jgi:hypothetical protein